MVVLEKEIGRFTVRYNLDGSETEASVHQIDMGGWLLYDCFLLPSYFLIQIVMENGRLEILETDDPELEVHAEMLLQMISKQNLYS